MTVSPTASGDRRRDDGGGGRAERLQEGPRDRALALRRAAAVHHGGCANPRSPMGHQESKGTGQNFRDSWEIVGGH